MEEIEESGTAVELYIYDLTKGMAAMMSKIVIGKIKKEILYYHIIVHHIKVLGNFELFSRIGGIEGSV